MSNPPDSQQCPICGSDVRPSARYPAYVCDACERRATAEDGRAVAFYNESLSGGCIGKYVSTGEEYPSDLCYIDGVACRAREARFGGIVVQPLPLQSFRPQQTHS